MKHYPPQFKADAVALYHSRPDVSAAQVARDLGIYPATLFGVDQGGGRIE
jgi:transposase